MARACPGSRRSRWTTSRCRCSRRSRCQAPDPYARTSPRDPRSPGTSAAYDVETESSNEGGDCADNPGALEFGKADRGGVAGGGALLSLGVIGVVLEARMVRGLKRLEEEATTGDSKNQVFSFLARLSFAGM